MFDNIDEDEINEEIFKLLNVDELQLCIANVNKELINTVQQLISSCAQNNFKAAKDCSSHYDKLDDIRDVLLALYDIKVDADESKVVFKEND